MTSLLTKEVPTVTVSVANHVIAKCPCCDREIKVAVPMWSKSDYQMHWGGKSVSMRPAQAAVARIIMKAYPMTASTDAIISEMYRGAREPDNAIGAVRANISQARRQLEEIGWTIRPVYGEGYRMERLA
jgi:DNA-binding response OmpR family regulator